MKPTDSDQEPDDPKPPKRVDPSAETVADFLDDEESSPDESATEQTLEIPTSDSSRPFGIGEASGQSEKTVPNVEKTIDMRTVKLRPSAHRTPTESASRPRVSRGKSVMQSADISQTINPRELSENDAAFWGSAAIGASKVNKGEKSKLRPAIERSIAESKLQIRERDLAVPTRDPSEPSDYRLVRLLGRGGMGNVYVARQASLDRMIAVKVIKPLSKSKRKTLSESGRLDEVEHERRQQFLSEAVVTGDLDHPNIVPIHDIAVAADNTLFYAMKRVVGQPWLKTINEKSRDENLEILLKACDAIAFAHTRGVIHRDIKPENIMLGDFGEVLVMDWGLAIATPEFEKRESIASASGLGGTPAFMAPEMALGPVDAIGSHSDIYLLGATLYYIITGHAPHKAENVTKCIRAVATNTIESAGPEHQGELLDIALRAMATEPSDRFENVKAFQDAIRSYRSHSESIAISTIAQRHYDDALKSSRYESFSRATLGFEQAILLWDGNESAHENLRRCQIDHAAAALAAGDYDLGLSLLNPSDSRHLPLIAQLKEGQKQREQKAKRLTLFRRLAIAGLIVILVGGAGALYSINKARKATKFQRDAALVQKTKAEREKAIAESALLAESEAKKEEELARSAAEVAAAEAEKQRLKAFEAQKVAEQKKREADDALKAEADAKAQERLAKNEAIQAKQDAEKSEDAARALLAREEYQSYMSQIGLAALRIKDNEFDDARRILTSLRDESDDDVMAFEWRHLWQLANQSRSTVDVGAEVIDLLAIDQAVIAVTADGSVRRYAMDDGVISKTTPIWKQVDRQATCVALSPNAQTVSVGTRSGEVLLVNAMTGELSARYQAHQASISDIRYVSGRRLLTASKDRSVALWNIDTQSEVARCWHNAPVVALDALSSDGEDSFVLLAASSDSRSGRIVGWRFLAGDFENLGQFHEHQSPVTDVALHPGTGLAASADRDGNVYLWRYDQLRPTAVGQQIRNALSSTGQTRSGGAQLVSKQSRSEMKFRRWQAHSDRINAIRFDASGESLITASDDYTMSRWDVAKQTPVEVYRGHGGWVRSIGLLPQRDSGNTSWLLSGSTDGTLRTWDHGLPADNSTTEVKNELSPNVAGPTIHEAAILSARLDQWGSRLITASRDQTARVFAVDPATQSLRELAQMQPNGVNAGRLREGSDFLAMSVRVDRDNRRLFIGSADSVIRIWNLDTGTELGMLRGTGLNDSFSVSADGTRLLSGSSGSDAKVLLWNVDPSIPRPFVLHRLSGHAQAVTAMGVSSDGGTLVTGDRNGRCLVWDGETGKRIGQPFDQFRGNRINQLEFCRDDESIWIASDSGQLSEFSLSVKANTDSAELAEQRSLDHQGFVTSFSLSPDDRYVVSVSSLRRATSFDSTALLWDLTSNRSTPLDVVSEPISRDVQSVGNVNRIRSATFGPSGRRVLVCQKIERGTQGRISIIDRQNRQKIAFDLPASLGPAATGLLLSDDEMITINGESAFRWSTKTMVHEKSYRPHAAVTAACFSADGRLAATASRSVRLWRLGAGDVPPKSAGIAIDKLENPHSSAVARIQFSPVATDAGYQFVTAGQDGSCKLWHWAGSGIGFQLRRDLTLPGVRCIDLRYLPDGSALVTAGSDGHLRVLPIEKELPPSGELLLPSGLLPTCVSISKDGRYIAAGASDHSAYLYDLESGSQQPVAILTGHADQIESIKIIVDPSGKTRVATASRDKSVRLWDPRLESLTEGDESADRSEAFEILALRRHAAGVTAVDATGDGTLLLTAGADGNVFVWPAPLAAEGGEGRDNE